MPFHKSGALSYDYDHRLGFNVLCYFSTSYDHVSTSRRDAALALTVRTGAAPLRGGDKAHSKSMPHSRVKLNV